MMSLISLLIILYYACINFHKFGVARESARPTGVDKGGSSDFDKFPLISNYGMQSLKIWFLLIKDKQIFCVEVLYGLNHRGGFRDVLI